MLSNILSVVLFASAVVAHPTKENLDPSKWPSQDVIHKDVAIIGGGSSGTYSAVSLKDKGISSIVIEAQSHIGGHAATYKDPATGKPVDYTVVVFHNNDLVKKYFGRFNIPLVTQNLLAESANKTAMYDFKSGKAIIPAKVYSQEEIGAALVKYATFISQWPKLNDGLFLPDPVPEVLAQPLGQVAKEQGFEAALQTICNFNQAFGDQLSTPFAEVARVVNIDLLQNFQTGFLQPANHNVSSLYAAAQTELSAANSLLLSSWVINAKRTDQGVVLVVSTPSGKKLVVAKKLLVTIPAKLDYLREFDLSKPEIDIFGQFLNTGYYAGLVKDSGLPANLTTFNGQQNAAFNFASIPGPLLFGTTSTQLRTVFYAGARSKSTKPYNKDFVKKDIIASLKTLQKANPTVFTSTEPEIVAFADHAPFYLQVCAETIKKGFYKNLYALQGLRSTFYTGATFKGHDSSAIWKYSENVVIPQIVKSLRN